MPWKEIHVSDQRLRFIAAVKSGDESFAALCRHFGISRPTGYKWLTRYETASLDGLKDHSSAPHTSPQTTPTAIHDAILEAKRLHRKWGPALLRAHLQQTKPDTPWPATSTFGSILQAAGLTTTRPRTPNPPHQPRHLTPTTGNNSVWSMDFKGWFRTQDSQICYPFTLLDTTSRFLLRCQALAKTDTALVQPLLYAAFAEFGLPTVIRSDNGSPFASNGLARLSRLAIWCLTYGVRPEYTTPGHPQENGRLERFHGTLNRDLTYAPAATMAAQQRAFDAYRQEYNHVRPHSALGYHPPATVYTRSTRLVPEVPPGPFDYPEAMLVRFVHTNACIKWRGSLIYVSEAFQGQRVGLSPLTEQFYALYVGILPVAILDDTTRTWLPTAQASPWLLTLRAEEQPPAD